MKSIFPTIVLISGVIAQFGFFLQTYKIIKNKSSENVSISTYFFFLPSFLLWLIYGIMLKDFVITGNISVALLGATSVIISYYLYKRKED